MKIKYCQITILKLKTNQLTQINFTIFPFKNWILANIQIIEYSTYYFIVIFMDCDEYIIGGILLRRNKCFCYESGQLC